MEVCFRLVNLFSQEEASERPPLLPKELFRIKQTIQQLFLTLFQPVALLGETQEDSHLLLPFHRLPGSCLWLTSAMTPGIRTF